MNTKIKYALWVLFFAVFFIPLIILMKIFVNEHGLEDDNILLMLVLAMLSGWVIGLGREPRKPKKKEKEWVKE